MSIVADIQRVTEHKGLPEDEELQNWARIAVEHKTTDAELTIRIVTCKESQQLNSTYRNHNKPTNVLAFPFAVPNCITSNLLGDLVICAEIVSHEAQQQDKSLHAHWAHIVIHGCLHLLGYDHITDSDAGIMEALETKLVVKAGFSDPYQ